MTDDASRPARRALVRLTEPAVDDLHKLMRKDPQIVRWCLKKMLLLERDPLAGEPLVGGLVGFRRLVVSDRHWRVVWRVTTDASGTSSVEIAEVWAAGPRAESEVYDEMNERLAALGDTPEAKALHEIVSTLGRIGRGLDVAPEPGTPEPVPQWLRTALTTTVGLTTAETDAMSPDEAMARLQAHWTSPPAIENPDA